MTSTKEFIPYTNNTYWLEWYRQRVQESTLTWTSSGVKHYRGYGMLAIPNDLTVTTYGKTYIIDYDAELVKGAEDSYEHSLIYNSPTLDFKNPSFIWIKEYEEGDGYISLNFIEDQDMSWNFEMPNYSLPDHAAEQMRDLWEEWCLKVKQYKIYNRYMTLSSRSLLAVRPTEPQSPSAGASIKDRQEYVNEFRQYTSLMSTYGQNISDALELEVLDQQLDKSITTKEVQMCSTFFGYFLSKCKDDMTRLRHLMCYIVIRQIDSGR